ncbi:universal stress protein [Streptomyces sp.]|uniref:universal stress protein n=1 Tax=Streptomyces sp. TaxID=1931 RepID=UPI002D2D7E5C|nr:universal stress protein [Streptomyces sp.]HZF92355.1 universal stress protein [Streptomyces sp.]
MDTLPVIAAFDGSDDSVRALDWALDAARVRATTLRVVHVRQYAAWAPAGITVPPPPVGEDDPALAEARAHVAGRPAPPAVEYLAGDGAPSAVLCELSAEAQLLVLGSRGRGGFASLLLGSNGLSAARDAECPVVVVPRPGRELTDVPAADPGPRVVVGLNIDSPDDAALGFAFAEAAARDARLEVVAAYPWPLQLWAGASGELLSTMIDQDAVEHEARVLADGFLAPHRGRHPGVRAEAYVTPGDAAGRLVAAAQGAELTVVGRHRRRLLAPARMLGSVTQAVLLHAPSPIAVIPPAPPDE